MSTLDLTTWREYSAGADASARTQAIIDALSGTVTVNIKDGDGTTKATGTMASPWASESSGSLIIGESDGYVTVSESGTPDSTWYIEFTNGTRWFRASFGLSNSQQDFKWSRSTFEAGQTATFGTAELGTHNIYAPVFTLSPASTTIYVSGDIQFTATDADGDDILYSLPATRTGITINSSTGLVSVTSAAAGTSGDITVRASDGQLSVDTTCSITVGVSDVFNPSYPRTAVYWIGTYTWTPTMAELASKFDVTILAWYPNRTNYGSYNSLSALGTAIKSYNANAKLVPYTIPVNVGTDSSEWNEVRAKLAAESCGIHDWKLRNAAGTIIAPFGGNTEGTNMTRYVDTDASGYNWPQWFARYCDGKFGSGPFDGVFQDVVYNDGAVFSATNSADWDGDGVNEADTDQAIEDALAIGQADFALEWNSIKPDWWVIGNFLDVSRYTIPSVWQSLYHGGLQEFAIGLSWSVEEWGGWSTMMQWYRTNLSILRSPAIGILHATDDYPMTNWTRYLLGGVTESDQQLQYRVMRYGLCSALMDNGYFAFSDYEYHTNTKWIDEYDWNLGDPTETPRTSAYSLGVYLRQFDNGCAIVNPKGNGQRTITLPSAGSGYRWDLINGSQAPLVNTGAQNVISVTINERDGLILKRVAA